MDVIVWLCILIAAILIEIATLGLATIWFAGGALVSVIIAALGVHNTPIQIGVFAVVSALLVIFARPIAVRYFNKGRVRTNVEDVVGKMGIVTTQIDNLQGTGRVTLSGQEWSARTKEDGMTIPEGAIVNVVAVRGVKLVVEEKAQEAAEE